VSRLATLSASVWVLSALRVAAESDLLSALASGPAASDALSAKAGLDPAVTLRLLQTLAEAGFLERPDPGGRFALSTEGADLARRPEWLRADLAATFGQAGAFVVASRANDLGGGWQQTDPEVVRAQSALSRALTGRMMAAMVDQVPELARLERPGARFLDAGAGGASVAIGFCRRFPELRAVATDPLRLARLEAKTAIAIAGLEDRIEVRGARIEELTDASAFDAAFVAAAFMPDAALAAGLVRIREGLVPGGVVLLGGFEVPDDPLVAAVTSLRWQLWGSGVRGPKAVIALLERAGFVNIDAAPAQGNLVPIAARRPA